MMVRIIDQPHPGREVLTRGTKQKVDLLIKPSFCKMKIKRGDGHKMYGISQMMPTNREDLHLRKISK